MARTDSGTFDYFTDVINGEEGASRTDYSATEDDNVTVQGVSGDRGALGYFGFSYFEENRDTLKALEVDGGSGCVAPGVETAQDGSYTPLARPLFMYVKLSSLADNPSVSEFVSYALENAEPIATPSPLRPRQTTRRREARGRDLVGYDRRRHRSRGGGDISPPQEDRGESR